MSVRPSVRAAQTCLILPYKISCIRGSLEIPSLSRAVNLHFYRSESTQRTLKEHSEHTNQSHTNQSLKNCVLFINEP